MNDPTDPRERAKLELLRLTLEAAVPLEIARLRQDLAPLSEADAWTEILSRARAAGDLIAGPAGADVLYRSAKPDKTAEAFAALARGLACLAFAQGGVCAFGLHFEAKLRE